MYRFQTHRPLKTQYRVQIAQTGCIMLLPAASEHVSGEHIANEEK